ncbi:MAG: homoserine O-acetyltransferase MetX [Acidimicrobiales bacterium]
MTGAWRPGDHPGRRIFVTLFENEPLQLELGGTLGPITVAFETWGRPSSEDGGPNNAVLVLHALTGDSHAAGSIEPGHLSPGWWDGLIGPGKGIDTDRWWVVCPNTLGGCQGTTGPSSDAPDGTPWGSRFPTVTVRDQVAVEVAMASALGIRRWACVIGGSMGGMRALEWAVGHPQHVERLVFLASGAAATAEQIALCAAQAQAIRLDPGFRGGDYYDAPPGEGPHRGLGLARRVGHVSYRSEAELSARFGRQAQTGEDPLAGGWASNPAPGGSPDWPAGGPAAGARYSIESYLDHQAEKLVRRFDANTYLVLSRTMDHHDVGRGRGGVAAALAQVTARTTVITIDSDRLYPPRLQEEVASLIGGQVSRHVIDSPYGHDAFLIESTQIGEIVAAALAS